MKASSLFSVLTTGAALTNAIPVKQDPSIGKLPPMGFNSWNAFKCDIDETKFLVAAQKMIELGLKDAGYEYVNIDDCWAVKSGRDPVTGRILPDTTKFPEGIKGTADKIHAMGLKIGIYSDAGVETCAGYPGSLYYEHVDAQTFEEWGIDFLKYDNCAVPSNWTDEYIWYPENWYGTHEDQPTGSAPLDYDFSKTNQTERYARMKRALDAIERPIFYSLCNWGHQHVERWGKDMGQTWRMWGDIYPEWDGRYDYSWGVTPILNHASFFAEYSDFYGHNDFDMLEVGNGNLTLAEMRSHFALWAALKSPLLIGTPLDKITPETAAILLNKELISFNQDPNYGKSALPFKWGINPDWTWNRTHPAEYWSGQSSRGIHVFILNSLSSTETKSLSFKDVPGLNGKEKYEVWDMWTSKRIGTFKGKLEIKIEGHDTAALRITKVGGKHPHKGKLPLPKIWKDKPLRSVWPLPKGWKGRA